MNQGGDASEMDLQRAARLLRGGALATLAWKEVLVPWLERRKAQKSQAGPVDWQSPQK